MMRRRMMMGRETPIQYLKRIGCKLWLPLNSEYGLEAAIGNTRIVNVVSNAVTINTSVDMGEFRLGGVDVPVATLTTDWTSADFPNDEWTTFAQGKKYTTSPYVGGTGNVMKFPTIGNAYRTVVGCVNVNNTSYSTNWDSKKQNSFQMFKSIEQSTERKWYWSDGIIKPVLTLDDIATKQPVPFSERVINVASYANWSSNKRIFISNIMIFNRHLTENEMQKVLEILQQQ